MASQASSVSMSEAALISGLERVIPGYVRESNPTLVNQLKDEILGNYVVIDKAEIVKKTFQTVSLKFPGVKRGDLITADLMNQIIRAIENLDERVTELEAGTVGDQSVVITELRPPGPIQVLAELRILGRNFRFSQGSQRVSFRRTGAGFNDIPVNTYKPGSNDTLLIIDVPDIPNLPESGDIVTINVSNGISSDTRQIRVLPLPQPLIGSVLVTNQSDTDPTPVVSPSPIVAGRNADFVYFLSSTANRIATFRITATIGGPNWQHLVQILDSEKTIIPNGDLRLQPRVPTRIFVRIHPVPAGTTRTEFTLSVDVSSGDVSGNSGVDEYIVGQAPQPQDDTIGLAFSSAQPDAAVEAGTIQLPRDESAHIRLLATFTFSGEHNYRVTASLVPPAENWLLRLFDPTPDNTAVLNIGTLPVTVGEQGTMESRTLDIGIMPQEGASSTGQVEFTVQRIGADTGKTHRMNLRLL